MVERREGLTRGKEWASHVIWRAWGEFSGQNLPRLVGAQHRPGWRQLNRAPHGWEQGIYRTYQI
jgi:hypothetical protein